MNAQLTHVGTATLLLELAGLRLLTDPVFDPAGTRHSLATLLGTLALSPVDGPHLSIRYTMRFARPRSWRLAHRGHAARSSKHAA